MRKLELIRSTPLRLAFAFALAMIVLTGGVFTFVYVATTRAWIAELQHVFADEAEKAASSDDERLRRALSLRLTRDFRRLNYVALYDSSGALVFGNFDHRPDIPVDGRARVIDDFQAAAGAEPEPTLLVARARPNGGVIVLGRSLDEVTTLRRILARALSFAILPLAASALAIGLFFARRTASRIRDIDRAIEAIMQGDLRARLPRSGIEELDGVIGSVNLMLDEIERLLGQLGAVGGNIAHDLRAPVANVRAMLEQALAAAPKNDSLRAPIQSALRQLDRALTTISALLRISSIENEHRHSAFRRIDLAALCAELQEFFLPLAQAKGVAMTLAAKNPVWRQGDADLMREAIANLVDNALKFTPRGGAVRIEVFERDGRSFIEVSDNGRGVPAAEVHDIFRRFARARGGADQPGVGIGLNIAETIARLHHMELGVADNAPGARFTLTELREEQPRDVRDAFSR
jgi:signal transduction histidine kinase